MQALVWPVDLSLFSHYVFESPESSGENAWDGAFAVSGRSVPAWREAVPAVASPSPL